MLNEDEDPIITAAGILSSMLAALEAMTTDLVQMGLYSAATATIHAAERVSAALDDLPCPECGGPVGDPDSDSDAEKN